MIRLPILKDELTFLEKLLPDLETRPDLAHVAIEIKKRIEKIRQEIRALQEKGCPKSKVVQLPIDEKSRLRSKSLNERNPVYIN
jgi:hypothetical protein